MCMCMSIKSPKTKNSYEYDEISTKILKISCPFISSPINYICNKMLFWGVFTYRLKHTIIKPLNKNDESYEVSNYRPVSHIIWFSKIYESAMQRRILKHVTKYNIFSTEQYGFRVWLRTDNATYKLVVSPRGRIVDVVPSMEVGFEPRVKSGERQTAYSDK